MSGKWELYTPKFAEVVSILREMAKDKTRAQHHEFKHPSGILEVSVTPPNDDDESEDYHCSMYIYNTHSLYMRCDSMGAAAAFVASIMCMKDDIEGN